MASGFCKKKIKEKKFNYGLVLSCDNNQPFVILSAANSNPKGGLMDIGTKLMGRDLEARIMIGAGVCKVLDDVKLLLETPCGGIVVGSATRQERFLHLGNNFHWNTIRSANSYGLPNPGEDYYACYLPEMVRRAHDKGKVLHFSIAGETVDDYSFLAEIACNAGVDCIEINFGCGNRWDPNTNRQERIFTYDPDMVCRVIVGIRRVVGNNCPLSAKFSPHVDRVTLEITALLIHSHAWVESLVTTNTFPNILPLRKNGEPMLVPQYGGFSSMGGSAMKDIGLGQVAMWRNCLHPKIQIQGIGGISTGQDVVDYIHAGADSVQVVTDVIKSGRINPKAVEKLVIDFVDKAPVSLINR